MFANEKRIKDRNLCIKDMWVLKGYFLLFLLYRYIYGRKLNEKKIIMYYRTRFVSDRLR